MKVLDSVEHEDGSATYTFEMTEEERKLMIENGILWGIVSGITGITVNKAMSDYYDSFTEADERAKKEKKNGHNKGDAGKA